MKKSNYTIVVPLSEKGPGFLVHSYTGAIDFIGPDLLSWFSSNDDIAALPEATRNKLAKRGYLWSEEVMDEKQFFKSISESIHRNNIADLVNTFWIIPTYRCNLRCYYCFQSHKIHAGEGIGKDIMSIPTIESLFKAFEELGGPGPRAKIDKGRYITLFGGEPMMAQTLESVTTIVKLAREQKYRVGAITNGVDLNLFSGLLGPEKIRWIQITLDGLGALNDKRRFPTEGDGFLKIVNNISMALENGCQVSLRTNTDKTLLTKIQELERFAVERGWVNYKGFSWYMTPVESHVNKSSSSLTVTNIDIVKQIQEHDGNIIKSPYRSKFLNILKTLETENISNQIETSACGAHTRMYYFDPQGLIYACAEQVGKAEYAIGSYKGNSYSLDPDKSSVWLTRHVGNMPVCSGCKFAFFCGGGCANAARIESGEFLGPRCYGMKETFPHVALEYAKNKINSMTYEMDLKGFEIKSINTDDQLMPSDSPQHYIQKMSEFSDH